MKKVLVVLIFVSLNLFSQKIDFKTSTDKLSEPNAWSKLIEFDNGETSYLIAHEQSRFIQIITYTSDHSVKYNSELHFNNVDKNDPLYVLAVYKISEQIVIFLNVAKEEEIQIKRVIVDPATGTIKKDEVIDALPIKKKRLKFIINYPYTVVKKGEETDDYTLISIFKTEDDMHKLTVKNFDATHVLGGTFKGPYSFEFDKMEFSGSYVDPSGNSYFVLNNIVAEKDIDRSHLIMFRLQKKSTKLEQISIKQKNMYAAATCHFTNDKKNKMLNIWINYINQVQGWSAVKSNTFLYKLNLVNFTMAPEIRIRNERIFEIEKRTTALTDKDKPEFVEYPQQVYTDENGKNLAFFQRLKTNCKDVCTTSIYDMALYSMNENGVIDSTYVEPLNLFIPYSSLDEKDYSFRNTDWEKGKSGLFTNTPIVVNQTGMMSVKYLDFIFTPEGNKYVVYNDLPSNIAKGAGEKVEEYKKAGDGEACIMEVNSANVMKRNLLSTMSGSGKKIYLCMLTSDYNPKTKTFTSVYVDKDNGDAHIIWFKL